MNKKNEAIKEPEQDNSLLRFKDIYSKLPHGYNAGGRPNLSSTYNAVVGTLGSLQTIEKEDLEEAIKSLPNVFIFDDLSEKYNLPKDFEGKKYTFYGAIKLRLEFTGMGGIIRSIPVHKLFVAHLIQPPEYEKWKKMIDRHPNENYTEWWNNRDKNENFMKYEEFCQKNGFEHIIHNKPTYLLDKIFKVLETTRGQINP